jgi:hypothetical protein
MAKDAYIAIWHLNTRVDTAGGAKLVAADQAFSRLGAQPGDIQVFAAPEYYFAKSGDKILGYSAAEKDQIKQSLLQLSATYPDVVLIPGTVAWKEELKRADRATTATQVTTAIASLPETCQLNIRRNCSRHTTGSSSDEIASVCRRLPRCAGSDTTPPTCTARVCSSAS